MKIVTKILLLSVLISALSLMMRCVYGGPGSSSEVRGIFLGPGGNEPACYASVTIRSHNYLEPPPALEKRGSVDPHFADSTRTNNSGCYRFDSIPEGLYCIEGIDSNGNKAFRDSIMVGKSFDYPIFLDTLKPTATLKGTMMPDSSYAKGYVRVFGLAAIAIVDSNSSFTLANLPAGNLHLQIVTVYGIDTVYDTVEVVTEAGKTGSIDSFFKNRYLLTVTGSGNGRVSGSDSVMRGIPHAITANPDSGYHFSGWHVTNGKAAIADSMEDSTTVTLKNRDVTVQAIFKAGYTFQMRYDIDVSLSEWNSIGQQTSDGQYIVVGYIESALANFSNLFLIKTNAAGAVAWTKTFNGAYYVHSNSMQQTSDGGYIITGSTDSSNLNAYLYVYLLKTDAAGNATWTKSFGDTNRIAIGKSVQQTKDGGYIITGSIKPYKTDSITYNDVYLIKTDAMGNLIWTKTFGNAQNDEGNSVRQTSDGGYIIAGFTDLGANSGMYLIKIDSSGSALWTKTFSDSGNYAGNAVQQTNDEGYIVTGSTNSSYDIGNNDVCLLKTNAAGNLSWKKTFGGGEDDGGNSVQQTNDGGYIIAGYTYSYGAGSRDVYLIKTDAAGNPTWTKTFGAEHADYGNSVQQTSDGGYFIAGYSWTFDGNSVYLIKTDENGNVK